MYSSDLYRAPQTYCRCTCGKYQPPTCLFILSRASRIEIVSYDISALCHAVLFHHAVGYDL